MMSSSGSEGKKTQTVVMTAGTGVAVELKQVVWLCSEVSRRLMSPLCLSIWASSSSGVCVYVCSVLVLVPRAAHTISHVLTVTLSLSISQVVRVCVL